MLKFKIILFLLLLTIHNCFFGDTNKDEKKKAGQDQRFVLLQFASLSRGQKEEGIVVDNNNGTLNYTYRLIETNGWIGNRTLVEKTILIRRCLIGQVYRQAQNDCQGNGTKATVWGASRLQWCPTNDRACEIDGKADPTKSPAAKACADDTFLSKKWMLPSKDDGLGSLSNYHKTNLLIYSDWSDNFSERFYFWSEESKTDFNAFNPVNPLGSFSKTDTDIHILCKEKK